MIKLIAILAITSLVSADAHLPYIETPSTRTADKIGKSIADGFSTALEKSISNRDIYNVLRDCSEQEGYFDPENPHCDEIDFINRVYMRALVDLRVANNQIVRQLLDKWYINKLLDAQNRKSCGYGACATYQKKSPYAGYGKISNATGRPKTKIASGHVKRTRHGVIYVAPYAKSR